MIVQSRELSHQPKSKFSSSLGITIRPELVVEWRHSRTLASEGALSGIGLHTGGPVEMRLLPAPAGTGICFRRVDLPGQPIIPAQVDSVRSTNRATVLAAGQASVHTVEHVLAALRAFRIDNAVVELSDAEPPVAGGCSLPFVKMIEKVGVVEQEEKVPVVRLDTPVFFSDGSVHLVALPSEEYRLSYTMYYPTAVSPSVRCQFFSSAITAETFTRELAPCRSFAMYEELAALLDAGLIRGTSLDSGLVIKGEAILSKDGLHFPDELVRHKILDMVGDLSLLGVELQAHVIAIRAGHTSNAALVRKLHHHISLQRGQ